MRATETVAALPSDRAPVHSSAIIIVPASARPANRKGRTLLPGKHSETT